MAKSQPIKVRLTNQGDDSETPWAEDLGPAPGHPRGARKVRLINVPFMHAKPTWGDTIVVMPVDDGFPTWDRGGVPWAQITTRLEEDGGRWAMILDYAPHPDAKDPFGALAHACAEQDVVCEGAWGPRADGEPGRAYLAVTNELSDADLMKHLRAAALPCELVQIHPEPMIQPRAGAVGAKRVASSPAAAKPAAAKPAAAKPAAAKPDGAKPATAQPGAMNAAAMKAAMASPAASRASGGKPAPAKPSSSKPVAARPAPKPAGKSAAPAKAAVAKPAAKAAGGRVQSVAAKAAPAKPAAKSGTTKKPSTNKR